MIQLDQANHHGYYNFYHQIEVNPTSQTAWDTCWAKLVAGEELTQATNKPEQHT